MSIELALIWIGWVVAGGSPGPATLGIAGTSMQNGRRAGLFFALGILAGSASWGIAAALGMSTLMLANAWLFATVKYLGAGYLLYLAIKSLRAAFADKPMVQGRAQTGAPLTLFTKGALIHLTNPKAILSWGAIYAIALPSGAGSAQVFGLFAYLFAGSILVFVGYALLFSTVGAVRAYAAARRWFEVTFAAFFGAASLKILTVRAE